MFPKIHYETWSVFNEGETMRERTRPMLILFYCPSVSQYYKQERIGYVKVNGPWNGHINVKELEGGIICHC